MATSGTVGGTVVDVTTVIEHAARRCGKLASSLTSEQTYAARENLYFILSDLVNRGINLWTISKQILTVTPGQYLYPTSASVVDILKAFWRTSTPQSGTVIMGTNYQGIDAGAGSTFSPCMVQVTFNVGGTNNLVIESSPDTITWTTIQTIPQFSAAAGTQQWLDITNSTAARAFRVRETVLPTDNMSASTWNFGPNDILMAKLNRDQYFLMPNKSFQSTRSLQYWYDKQVVPQLWLWPAPTDTTASIVLWYTSHIQDPGALTNTLQIPIRWQNGIIWLLAAYMANELPDVAPDKLKLCMSMSGQALEAAEDGESDGSPIQFDPGIMPYTR